jgi:Flp pilus assembly protein TadD
MNDHPELLDTSELMHLALDATARSQNGLAMEYLKRLLAHDPDNAEAHYLLGAQQAQVGMPDRAIVSMSRAIALRPSLHAARFQLGMLLATSNRVEDARITWLPLDELGPNEPFYLFKTGFLHLANDEYAACIACLQRGIAVNDTNVPLNDDMAQVIARVKLRLGREGDASPQPADPAQPADTAESSDDVPAMFLDAYKGKVH